ncbi:MAG: hypothetical protein JNL70_22085 [Saprospiraceae bacterium]|nr:hypothetical protein [Saprospiraceae bacterium]
MIKKHLLLWLCLLPFMAVGQINQMQFGKNRVQFHKLFDDWEQYESENFITYWYGQGRFVGQAAAQLAEMDFEEIQKTLEYRLNDKMEIIVYTDLTDLHQSNIGTEETFVTKGGLVKVVGEKMFVYFDGDHTHLRKQVREGIAGVFLNAMLFGSNLQEVVQNAISLNLPEWYKVGLLAYIGEEWSTDSDDRLRDIFQSKKYKSFNKFAQAEPRLAGQAFWYYIAQQFGKANVSNLLYLTRINRSLDDAVMYVLGSPFEATSLACMEFYRKRYERELLDAIKLNVSKQVKIKNKRKLPMPQVKISPDGQRLAYVQNEIGRWKVYVQEVSSGKKEIILRGGTRNPFQSTDYQYPHIAWNPDNQRVFVVYEKRDLVYTFEKNVKDKKVKNKTTKFNPDVQRVFSIDFLNGKDMVLTASVRGYSDVFVYNTATTGLRQLSNDHWDDLGAIAVNLDGRKGIVFSSNRLNERWENERLDSVLPVNRFDLFYKDLEDTSKNLVRITHTPDADERSAVAIDTTFFGFLSDESGVFNRQLAYLKDVLVRTDTVFYITNEFKEKVDITVMQDSMRQFPPTQKIDSFILKPILKKVAIVSNNTNYTHNIVAQSTAPRVGKVAEVYITEGVPHVQIVPLHIDSLITASFTRFWQWKKQIQIKQNKGKSVPPNNIMQPVVEPKTPVNEPKTDTTKAKKKLDIDSYVFQSEFDNDEKPKTTQITPDKIEPKTEVIPSVSEPKMVAAALKNDGSDKKIHVFRPGRISPYRLKFRSDYFTSKLDNNLLFGGLDSYAGTPQGFATPPMGILMKGNFKDLLEDYQLEGGVRIPTTFNGYEAFAFFDDKRHRLDKRYAIYHKSTKFSDNNSSVLDNRRSRTQTSLGQYELRYPLDIYQRVQATATLRSDRYTQLATDQTSLTAPTLKEQRVGVRVDYVFDNAIDLEVNAKMGSRAKVWVDFVKKFELDFVDNFAFKTNAGFMGIIGFDARHYERILRHSIFAIRGAGATSFGAEKNLFILGGVDNQLFANFNDNVSIPQGNYAFQTLAANMRGFSRNIRNGTSNVVFNAELRVPIVKYFSSRPLTSSFWRNFQLVGFFDAGTAWHGANPFRIDNPLNTVVLPKDANANTAVTIKVNYFKDPIVASYGFGARLLVFGYTIRADYGWGIETREVQKPMLHLALGTDF